MTGSESLLAATILQPFQALMALGGPVVALLLFCSVLATAIVFMKLWQFYQLQIGDTSKPRQSVGLFRRGAVGDAIGTLQSSRGPLGNAVLLAIQGRRRNLPEEKLREEIFHFCSDQLAMLRQWLRPLEVIAALAPLLGLFGTVLGMIEAFQQMESAGSSVNPAILSGGIWEALLTTAVGLGVAMPVLVCVNWLDRRIERLAQEMDSLVSQVFTAEVADESLSDRYDSGRVSTIQTQ